MSPTAVDCRGVTQTGNPCRNATTNPDGWCRRCAGVPAAVPAGAVDPLLAATTAATEPGGGGIKIVTTLSPETERRSLPPATPRRSTTRTSTGC